MDPVLDWLAALGVSPAEALSGWTLVGAQRDPRRDVVAMTLARGGERLEVRLEPTDPARRAYKRTRSFDVSYRHPGGEAPRDVVPLMDALVARIERGDPGGLALPAASPSSSSSSASPPRAPGPASASPGGDAGAYAGASSDVVDDPARRARDDAPFMRFEYVDAGDLARFPDALREMYDGTLGGLVVRGAFDKAFMRDVVARLEAREVAFPETAFPPKFKAFFYGRCLDGSDPALTQYLPDAERFREQTRVAFRAGPDFEARVEELLGALSGGRPVELPRFTDGRAYTPATIRILPEGGQIGTHCGNEASTRPAYTHLNAMIDRHDQISWFVTLQAPERGGELIVYSLKWSDIDQTHIRGGRTAVDHLLADAQWMPIAPEAGDLLLFDGGRYFHRVAVVEGSRTRWTMGGFLMFSRDGTRVYYWS